jgi:hypothetical protein
LIHDDRCLIWAEQQSALVRPVGAFRSVPWTFPPTETGGRRQPLALGYFAVTSTERHALPLTLTLMPAVVAYGALAEPLR